MLIYFDGRERKHMTNILYNPLLATYQKFASLAQDSGDSDHHPKWAGQAWIKI